MVFNIPKLMINNIIDPEKSKNTEKTKYLPPTPKKTTPRNIFKLCKSKDRKHWKSQMWRRKGHYWQKSKNKRVVFPSEAVQAR